MEYVKVTAIIQSSVLEKVERGLQEHGVRGISVTKVKDYGEYANFYSRDCMTTHAKLEIFTGQSHARAIVDAILESAHLGLVGDGIVAVQPVEQIFRIRTRGVVKADQV